MLVAGVDVGAATAKAVILRDSEILGYAVKPVGYDVKLAANEITKQRRYCLLFLGGNCGSNSNGHVLCRRINT